MKPDYLEVRDWECLKFCETKENCLYACGLLPPHEAGEPEEAAENKSPTYPVRFVFNPGKVQVSSKNPALV